jgi:hypothetical protein
MSELNSLSNSISTNRNISTDRKKSSSSIGIVVDVILDENHPAIKEFNGLDIQKNTSVIGAVVLKDSGDVYTRDDQFIIAYPYDRNFINLPVKNELVEIIHSAGYTFYKSNTPTVNPNETGNKTSIKESRGYFETFDGLGKSSVVNSYKKTSNTGITKTKGKDSPYNDESYGKHYDVDQKLHRLKLYEGDSLIESRFGQSIRFSGYDNKDNKFYPSITIRNRENDLSKEEKKSGEFTLEDINRDGSIIILSAAKKVLPFQPGTVDKSNKSDFKTKPKSWTVGTPKQKNKKFPDTLDGDQVLINSDRIILSSKKNEMIFYSKGNIGIISDAHWSWDLAEGIDANIGGNWHVITNNHDFRTFNGTKGRNILGSGDNLQNIPRGNDLIEWLGQLIDLITTNIYATPAGPTSPGPPNNIPKYQQLKAKLPRLLSKLNYTGNEPKPESSSSSTNQTKALTDKLDFSKTNLDPNDPDIKKIIAPSAAAIGVAAMAFISADIADGTFDAKNFKLEDYESAAGESDAVKADALNDALIEQGILPEKEDIPPPSGDKKKSLLRLAIDVSKRTGRTQSGRIRYETISTGYKKGVHGLCSAGVQLVVAAMLGVDAFASTTGNADHFSFIRETIPSSSGRPYGSGQGFAKSVGGKKYYNDKVKVGFSYINNPTQWQVGDILAFGYRSRNYGHIQVYTGFGWQCDYVQNGINCLSSADPNTFALWRLNSNGISAVKNQRTKYSKLRD